MTTEEQRQTVPVRQEPSRWNRVRLEKKATTREETVGGTVRKEHIEIEGAEEDR